MENETVNAPAPKNALERVIWFCLNNKLIVAILALIVIGWGILVAPFDWRIPGVPRDPVPVDAIPDIGENQQIVFTEWAGRSPQDVEDQVTYPLTVSLLGIPGVRTVRSFSFFGFSSIYIIFEEDVEFYWSRSRVLEKLNSLPGGTLPEGVQPALGPDATALGQVFWYTLEGRDPDGNPTGGWDLHELRTIQDWQVRYALQSVTGVSEVASIGGHTQEYQIDIDPDAMRAYDVTLDQIFRAVQMSNVDVGARTIEVNAVEYVIRGLGFIEDLEDIKDTVILSRDNIPIYVRNVAEVTLGPAMRRGALDKGGAEAVGGVVVVRYGENPLQAINAIKEKIREISPALPSKTLENGTESQVTVVPFYDRTGLIYETLGTLNTALYQEILVTIIVVLVMVVHFRSSFLISASLPLAVLMCFIAMKAFGVDANIVALSGIAIAIGTMVDMGVVISENILKHLNAARPDTSLRSVIFNATTEVGSAVLTAVLTTVISFLPVFAMEAAEGKLFKPLAFTKTFALIASVIVALTVIPPAAHALMGARIRTRFWEYAAAVAVIALGIVVGAYTYWLAGIAVMAVGVVRIVRAYIPGRYEQHTSLGVALLAAFAVVVLLADSWMPLGPEKGSLNIIFVAGLIGGVLALLIGFQRAYGTMLRWCLDNKLIALLPAFLLLVVGALAWLGVPAVFGWLPLGSTVKDSAMWNRAEAAFPGLAEEFMPPLDEGSFLFMPTTMPHVSIGKALEILKKQDMAIRSIPEVESVVGKIGRAGTPLDPAPISMVETVVNYRPEYVLDQSGNRMRFKYDATRDEYLRDDNGDLIEDPGGRPFRQWRPEIRTADDIWEEIVRAASIPGVTNAPKLQPIAARLVMLQSGMRAPMGVKVYGPSLEAIESAGLAIEAALKQVSQINRQTVIADRVVGKPYLEIDIDRKAIARYGLHVRQVQDVIEIAIGGRRVTTTVEGRERYPVRLRYMRELRDDIESLDKILVQTPGGIDIPLGQLSEIRYRPGPQAIKSEDTFLVSYVIFDKADGASEIEAVESAQQELQNRIDTGDLILPEGVSYRFAGNYENQIRSEQRLRVVLPVALLIIFLILYFQFSRTSTTFIVFSGILVAWAGGFLMLWLYGREGFLDFSVFGTNMRDLFQIREQNLSVAVWVGFLALFGIATDNGVILATYLRQTFAERNPDDVAGIREATLYAAQRRIRPCLMTSATTILALIPVLTSTGRGSDVMVPMAIPSFGGMVVVLISAFVVPVLYCAVQERRAR